MLQQLISFLLVLSLLFGFSTPILGAETVGADQMVRSASQWLAVQPNPTFPNWDIFALSRANACPKGMAEQYYNDISALSTAELAKKSASDIAIMILSLGAYGYDVAQIGAHNLNSLLVSKLNSMDFSDPNAFIRGYQTTATLWAPYLALSYGGIDGFAQNILAFYMAKHLSDEQYYAYTDQYPSVETEAMLIVALAPLKGKTLTLGNESYVVDQVIDTAFHYYRRIEQPAGGFKGAYGESVEANSWVAHAVYAAGADWNMPMLLSSIERFYDAETGGFQGYGGVNEYSTQQALYNLIGCKLSQTGESLFDISKTIATKAAPSPVIADNITDKGLLTPTGMYATVSIAHTPIQGSPVQLNQGETVMSLLTRLMGKENLEIDNGYVQGICCNGVWYREFAQGAKSGWKFSIDGQHIPTGASRVAVKNGTSVHWYFATGNETVGADGSVKYSAITNKDFNSILMDVTKRLQLEGLRDWDILAALLSGKKPAQTDLQAVTDLIACTKGDFRKVTDTAKYTLILARAGIDVRNVHGVNLVKKLQQHPRMTMQGINGPAFTLMALNSVAVADDSVPLWTKEALRAYILSAQNADGGFSLVPQEQSTVDVTAMALCALAPYRVQHAAAIERGVQYLSTVQQSNGGYLDGGAPNTESTAQVILALTALGINPDADSRFLKSGSNSPVDALLSFYVGNGMFSHGHGLSADEMASEQAALSLFALGRIGLSVYQTTKHFYDDFASISPWARDAVVSCYESGVMIGDGYAFHPADSVTLHQAKTVIHRIFGGNMATDIHGSEPITRAALLELMSSVNCGDLLYGNGTDLNLDARVTREMLSTVSARMLQRNRK